MVREERRLAMTGFSVHPSTLQALSARRIGGLSVAVAEPEQAVLLRKVTHELERLAHAGRRAITIVDFACGDGGVLIHACGYAQRLGFVVIDGRGFTTQRWHLFRARRAARSASGLAVSLIFTNYGREAVSALDEGDCDILIGNAPSRLAPELARLAAPHAAHFARR
jgi:hypothetical protein